MPNCSEHREATLVRMDDSTIRYKLQAARPSGITDFTSVTIRVSMMSVL